MKIPAVPSGDASRTALVAMLLILMACRAEPDINTAKGTEMTSAGDGSNTSATRPEEPPLSARCRLAGESIVDREDYFTLIAYYYISALGDDCKTGTLMNEMTLDQSADWLNYLANYTSALFDCGLILGPLPDGIEAFGIANTAVVGIANKMLGPDDAATLVDMYVATCAERLSLSIAELADVRVDLERAAHPWIDSNLSARLSACPQTPK